MAQWRKVVVSGSSAELNGLTLSGDLTVAGGDITLGTTSIFSGGDTAQLNNIDALDATTEATIEAAIDTLSNLTAASSLVTVSTLDSGAISSGFGNIDIGTSTLNTGNATVDTLTNDSAVGSSHLTGSFTGSFVGDGSNLTGVAQDIDSLTALGGATIAQDDYFHFSDGGTEKKVTFSNLEDSIFGNVSGDATIAAGGALTIAATSVENSMLAGSIANAKLSNSTISGVALGNNLNSLSITANGGIGMTSYNGSAAVSNLALDIDGMTDIGAGLASGDLIIVDDGAGGTNRKSTIDRVATLFAGDGLTASSAVLAVQVDDTTIETSSDTIQAKTAAIADGGSALATADQIHTFYTAGGSNLATAFNTDMGGNFTIGNQSDDTCTFSGPVTITGNLDVNGTVTTIDSANTYIADKYMIIASGSTSDTDGGIVVQNSSTAGYGLGYDSGVDRWAFDADLAHNATNLVPDAYVGVVETGTGDGDSQAVPIYGGTTNGVGTIYIDTDDSEIWIYA